MESAVLSNNIATSDKQAEIMARLSQFHGSETWYRSFLPWCIYSEGAKYLADTCQCYWLLDCLFSFRNKVLRNPKTKQFCLWTLTLLPEGGAKLQCWEDTNVKAFRICQTIPYTDFPLNEIKLYMSFDGRNLKVYLPSEY